MRTYGRVPDSEGNLTKWVEVTTDENGFDDYVWLTTMIQCLKLNLGESPFYASYGIPAKEAIIQQVAPDFYVSRLQRQFSQFFASLIVAKEATPIIPTYKINLTTQQGVKMVARASIPQ